MPDAAHPDRIGRRVDVAADVSVELLGARPRVLDRLSRPVAAAVTIRRFIGRMAPVHTPARPPAAVA